MQRRRETSRRRCCFSPTFLSLRTVTDFGQHAAADDRLPLRGVRVVSIAQNVPGPLVVARFVELGATAIKVEPPSGDPLATMCLSWYAELHRGVDVRRIDLKSADGTASLSAMLDSAELFVASHRPSALARLCLDPESLRAAHPKLRVLRLFGSIADPEAPGHDLTCQAHAGLLREGLPTALVADVMASERAFGAAMTLLRSDEGTVRDVGLAESLTPLVASVRHGLTSPGGLLGGGAPRYGVYPAKTGYVALAALDRTSRFDSMSAWGCRRDLIRRQHSQHDRPRNGKDGGDSTTCPSPRCADPVARRQTIASAQDENRAEVELVYEPVPEFLCILPDYATVAANPCASGRRRGRTGRARAGRFAYRGLCHSR